MEPHPDSKEIPMEPHPDNTPEKTLESALGSFETALLIAREAEAMHASRGRIAAHDIDRQTQLILEETAERIRAKRGACFSLAAKKRQSLTSQDRAWLEASHDALESVEKALKHIGEPEIHVFLAKALRLMKRLSPVQEEEAT